MSQFEKTFNYDNVFIRSVAIGMIKQFYRKLRWVNNFSSIDREVTIPFYYSNKGDDRFMIDAFIDDVVGKRPELNIDPVPRGIVKLTSASSKLNEYSNPNVNTLVYKEEDGEIKKVFGRYRPIPVLLTFNVEIRLESEIDIFKCQQSIWDLFWMYKYFYIDYKFMRIDAAMFISENQTTEISREINGLQTSKDKKSISFDVNIHSNYPIEPDDSKLINVNKKVVFKGDINSLRGKGRKRKFLGGNVN
jgi:hypothetical protein